MFRVALICEGPTDRAIIEAILDSHCDDYVLMPIQPPVCSIGGDAGPFGGGWKGVRRWCQTEVAGRKGLEHVAVLQNADLLIIQVDADVSFDDEIAQQKPCPPARSNADVVRSLILGWLSLKQTPNKTALCVPAMATEVWALVALFPDAAKFPSELESNQIPDIECRTDIKNIIRLFSSKLRPKLVVSQNGKLKNQAIAYVQQCQAISEAWPQVVNTCSEAARFDTELSTALALCSTGD